MDSYSCTYVDAERKLLASSMSFTALAVLRYLCSRADALGRCWPSQDTIAADLGGLRRETVNRNLADLERAGLLRLIQRAGTNAITGQRTTNVYMVSPFYFAVRPELQPDALALWNVTFEGGHVILGSHQPTTEPPTGTNDSNHRQEPTTTTTTAHDDEQYDQMRESLPDEEKQAKAKQVQRTEKQRTAETVETSEMSQQATFKDQGSAPLVKNGTYAKPRIHQYPPLESVRDELPDAAKERLAVRVRDEAQMPLPVARDLLNKYSGSAVEAVLNSGALAKAEKPGGLLRYLLHTGAVTSPGDAPGQVGSGGERYTNGKYAEYLNY